MTLVMIIMICVGCALIIAGLAVLATRALGLFRAARNAGVASADQIQTVVHRGRDLVLRLREFESKLRAVAERLHRLSATAEELNYLKDEIDRATGRLSKLKS